jgi:hypothetical protein
VNQHKAIAKYYARKIKHYYKSNENEAILTCISDEEQI